MSRRTNYPLVQYSLFSLCVPSAKRPCTDFDMKNSSTSRLKTVTVGWVYVLYIYYYNIHDGKAHLAHLKRVLLFTLFIRFNVCVPCKS